MGKALNLARYGPQDYVNLNPTTINWGTEKQNKKTLSLHIWCFFMVKHKGEGQNYPVLLNSTCLTGKPQLSYLLFLTAFKIQAFVLCSHGDDPNSERLICHGKPIFKANRAPALLRVCLPAVHLVSQWAWVVRKFLLIVGIHSVLDNQLVCFSLGKTISPTLHIP